MKAGNGCRKWCPTAGALVVGALAFAVSVQGGPRDDAGTRNKGATRSQTSRLVTGPDETFINIVAGGQIFVCGGGGFNNGEPCADDTECDSGNCAALACAPTVEGASGESCLNDADCDSGFCMAVTMEMLLKPVRRHAGPLGPCYGNINDASCSALGYSDADVSGQEITAVAGGFTAYFNLVLRNWAPSGLRLRTWQGKIDAMGYMSGDGDPLSLAGPACTTNSDCEAVHGAKGAKCSGGSCLGAWINKKRTDGVFFIANEEDCVASWDLGFSPSGPLIFGVSKTNDPPAFFSAADAGIDYVGGTLVLDVPAGAKGTYIIPMIEVETFAQDDTLTPSPIEMPLVLRAPGVITIVKGSCCTNLGPATSVCTPGVTKAECDALPSTNVNLFNDTDLNCSVDCPDCQPETEQADCNDQDRCTTDTCVDFICFNTADPNWNQATQCCDAGSGDICTPSDPNTCAVGSCSSAPNRGTCIVTAIGAGGTCTDPGDDNPCSFDDVCDGTGADTCSGTDVNGASLDCADDADCQSQTGLTAPVCINGKCECSLVPDLVINFDPSGKAVDKCFDSGDDGDKLTGNAFVAAATAAINGGQFLINYDPSCMEYVSITGADPYTTTVFGPVVDEAAGTIFIVVSVGFGADDGPAGNANMLTMSFKKIGTCNACDVCFDSNNPQNTYLVDNTGQRVGVNGLCSNTVVANNMVMIDTPGNVKTNVDCDRPSAVESWSAPTTDDMCGDATMMCRGEHQSGLVYSSEVVMGGGEFAQGVSNFCCWVQSDICGADAGCSADVASAARECTEGCWTVEVNDQTSLDIEVALSPTSQSKPGDELTRCIKFTLYPNTLQEPLRFSESITFGGALDFVGKSQDKIKIPGKGNWDCITAWDQLHTLRSCYLFGPDDCAGGQLSASFRGDPAFGGNWLVNGNLDGWKKDVSGAEPSLFVIDILDYGTLVSQWGADYGDGNTPCGTAGPNADLDGDGLVDMSDYAFIDMNFLTTAKVCCGVDGLPAATPLTEISTRELREMGRGELAVADLNGDGMLNIADMNAFMQGVRPSKKVSRTSRKGTGTR